MILLSVDVVCETCMYVVLGVWVVYVCYMCMEMCMYYMCVEVCVLYVCWWCIGR